MRDSVKVHRRRARAAFLVVTAAMTAGLVASSAQPSHATTYGTGFYLITVPPGVTQMTFDLYGAQGGGGGAASSGGLGGRATVTIDVTPGATLQLNVGGAGDNGVSPGYNGGGGHSPSKGGGNGGGATDLRLNDGTTKLLVAGGGGGGGADGLGVVGGNGGPGGAMTTLAGMGADGTPHGGANGGGGGGGSTDVAGGMGGTGGTGTVPGSNGSDGSAGQGGQGGDGFNFGGGGGGGGLYGGGGGGGGGAGATGNAPGGGGGGGSSFGPVGTTFEVGVRSADGSAVVSYTGGSTTTTTTIPSGSGLTRSFAVRVDTCVAGATPQLCTPIPTVPLPTDGVLQVRFDASTGHCADVIAHLLVDGVERFVSAALPPGESTGVRDFGPVAAGVHAVGVQAEGVVGGCNAGSIGSWSGTLTVTVTGITEVSGAIAAPGETVTVSTVVGASPAPAAIDASYTRPADAVGLATLVAATYLPPDPILPLGPLIPPNPIVGSVGFVDLLLLGASPDDQVQARFHPGDPIIPPNPILYFFDGTAWSPVIGSDGTPPAYVSGTGFSVSFTDTSKPAVTALGGTVFAFVATPASGCAATPVGATFASLACRLADLTADTQAASALGKLGPKLLVALGKATTSTTAAKSQCASGKKKQPKARLKQVGRRLLQYSHRLRSHAARKIPESVREPLAQTADGIGDDAKKLRGALRCPDDAAAM